MADTKITALAAITTVDPAADVLPIVDISDTSMAASGTTKKITSNQILGAGGTATLASATITGDLTVDTSTLKVDSANDRVGIGTATPVNTLEVVAPAGDNIVSTFRSGDATAANNAGGGFRSISSATAASRVAQVWLDADGANLSGGDYFYIQKNGSSGTVEFNQFSNAAMTFLTNSTERMRIDSSGNVALGQSSSALQSGGTGITLYGSTASEIKFLNSTTGSSATDGTALVTTGNNFSINNRESGFVSIGTSNTERVSVKTNGQVRFVPLAADPVGAETGDVYYNSTSNKLKCYNGTTWNDLF